MTAARGKVPRTFILGVTGSIGMGKSTVARMCAGRGVCISSADNFVHQLMRAGGKAVPAVLKAFPTVKAADGGIDRKALGAIVFKDKTQLKTLEHILHPLVVAAEIRFARAAMSKGAKLVVMEIPLLFETGAQARLDAVLVASAPAFLQRQRVLKRPGMTEEKFRAILKSQMPDAQKRRLATAVIPTGLGKAISFHHISPYLRSLAHA